MPISKGIFVAALVPLTTDGELNLSVIKDYCEFLVKNEVKGVFVNGTTGEGMKLSVEERKLVLETWMTYGKGSLTIINHIGCESVKDCQELAVHSESQGADGISLMQPLLYEPWGIENLVAFLSDVTKKAPSTPFYLYYGAGPSNMKINLTELLEVVKTRLPTFSGIKYSGSDLIDVMPCIASDSCDLLYGRDEQLLGAIAMGGQTGVGSTYNYLSNVDQRMLRAYEKGDMKTAQMEQQRAQQVINIILKHKRYSGIAGVTKAVMKLIGFDFGPPRVPDLPLSNDDRDSMRIDLQEVGFFEWRV
ncbi:N-acetylneuraminate lyase-like [Oscarella lobularis]|uniref:N-acetylneuraminate lyase-like n=1 Tax=Oscarella lobularis TaxID=121494 RepID=UPI0033138D66